MGKRKQVCLFGLSADPPTGEGGHLGIVQHLVSMGFDEVRVLPVYRHMFGNKRGKQAPFETRIEMCQILFKDISNVVVSDAEKVCFENLSQGLNDEQKTSLRVGTAELLDMLTRNEPTIDFTLSLGADTFIDLASGKWRRTKDVFRLVGYRIVVFQRKEDESSNNSTVEKNKLLQESIAKWQLINSTQSSIRVIDIPTLTEVSSSAVRRSTDQTVLQKMLSSEVLEYIQDKQMYALSDSK